MNESHHSYLSVISHIPKGHITHEIARARDIAQKKKNVHESCNTSQVDHDLTSSRWYDGRS